MDIRWTTSRDIPEIARIERASFRAPWTEQDIQAHLHAGCAASLVAMIDSQIVGYILCHAYRTHWLYIDSVAVAPEYRRDGVASALLADVERHTQAVPCRTMVTTIRERNVEGQKFFYANGFEVVRVRKNLFKGLDEDGYVFRRVLAVEPVRKSRKAIIGPVS